MNSQLRGPLIGPCLPGDTSVGLISSNQRRYAGKLSLIPGTGISFNFLDSVALARGPDVAATINGPPLDRPQPTVEQNVNDGSRTCLSPPFNERETPVAFGFASVFAIAWQHTGQGRGSPAFLETPSCACF